MGGRWNTYSIQLSFFALFILFSLIPARCSINSEGCALLEFTAGVDSDPFGVFANWNSDHCDPCKWSGVGCVDGKVHKLDLDGFRLRGELAPQLGKLAHLRTLILSKNKFSGTIPKEFCQLKMLEVLDLSGNNLSGTIPAEIGNMRSLRRLLLLNNNFEGSIPLELSKLKFLSELQVDEYLASTVSSSLCCLNRKLGHCICQTGAKFLIKVGSYVVPVKHVLRSYIDRFTSLKLVQKGSSSHRHALPSSNTPPSQRRRLIEAPNNLEATSPVDPSDKVIELPSSRSSGSYPAVYENVDNSYSSSPSPSATPSSHGSHLTPDNSGKDTRQPIEHHDSWKYVFGFSLAGSLLIVFAVIFFVCQTQAAKNIGPWRTGISGQLQKAFVTGVPKLNRTELETACEDFSNIIESLDNCTVYKGTLSSGVEIAVLSTAISGLRDWSKRAELVFRKKIDMLSRVNHKNFVNLIGYCEENEPFTRMMVFEYAPNGSLFEYLHIKEVEHLDWNARTRIIMGTAYCLLHMHELIPPVIHSNLNSRAVYLTDDYAAKIAEISFWRELTRKPKGENESEHSELPPAADSETNVYNFGIYLLEIISGKLPYSSSEGPLINWATQYLNDEEKTKSMVDPTLKSLKEEELNIICEVTRLCIQPDAGKRPTMKEVTEKMRSVIQIPPEAATPRLSPLWWAELEILSAESS